MAKKANKKRQNRQEVPQAIRWPPEMQECAKDAYLAWPGEKKKAVGACLKILQKRFKKVPNQVTIYNWANKYGWEEERQMRIKASIVDAAVEGMVQRPAAEVNPNELMTLLTGIIKEELDEGKLDSEGLKKIEEKIHETAERPLRPSELADLAHALADTTRARGKRGHLAAKVLQAFATALDALARREEKAVDTRAVCPALNGGAINPECPLLRHHDDEDIPR